MKIDINNLVKEAREQLGWTRDTLANYLDVHEEEVALWEKSMLEVPREAVFKIGFALGFDDGYGKLLMDASASEREKVEN
jgi:ribosome-binding protein aMBF1 (putative translation factor)